VVKLMSSWILP